MVAGGTKRSSDGVNVENRQARRRRLKREAAANESQTGARPCRRILGAPSLVISEKQEDIFIQRQKGLMCMMNSLNNVYGSIVVTFEDLDYTRRAIDNNKHWIKWRKDEVKKYVEKTKIKDKRRIDEYEKSLMNGGPKGYWTVNVLSDFLHTYTDVQLKKVTPENFSYEDNVKDKMDVIRTLEDQHGPLMIMLRWEEYRMNQAHWIAIRGGLVLDSGMKPRPRPIQMHKYAELVFVERIYCISLRSK